MSKIADFQNRINEQLQNVDVNLVAGWSNGGDFSDAMDITHRKTGKILAAGETDDRLDAFFAHCLASGRMLKFNNRFDALCYFDREADILVEDMD